MRHDFLRVLSQCDSISVPHSTVLPLPALYVVVFDRVVRGEAQCKTNLTGYSDFDMRGLRVKVRTSFVINSFKI